MKKTLLFAWLVGMSVSLHADVTVSWYKITFSGSVSEADVRSGNRQYRKRFFPLAKLCVVAQGVDAEALALLVRSYPDVPRLEIRDCPWLTSLAPLAPLQKLTSLTVRLPMLPAVQKRVKPLDVSGLNAFPALEELVLQGMPIPDLAPVGGCSRLKSLDFRTATLSDLAPLGGLSEVKSICLHGATLPDFAPLANLPGLESIDFSSAKVPDEKWSSLGALKQVKSFQGGSTKMTSLAWVKEIPRLETLMLFSEDVRDYSAIFGATNLTMFKAVSMRSPVDVSFVRGCPALRDFTVQSCYVHHLEALKDAPSIRSLDLSELKEECDLAFVSALVNLESLSIDRCRIRNFEAVKGLPLMRRLSLRSLLPQSSVVLKGIEACPRLESLTVSRGAFGDLEIGDVTHACQKNVTRFTVIQR